MFHGDSQGLKGSCLIVKTSVAVEDRHRIPDQRDQVKRGLQRATSSRPDHRARDPARIPFLPELVQQVGQLRLAELIEKLGRGSVATPIHAHIKRAVGEKTEPPIGPVQLSRRHSKVKHYAVHLRQAYRPQVLFQFPKIASNQARPACIRLEAAAGRGYPLLVLVHSNYTTAATPESQKGRRPATPPP